MAMDVLVLGNDEVRQCLPMDECIGVISDLFKTLAKGEAVLPLRSAVWQPDHRGLFAVMPAYLGSPRVIGGKFITFFPDNTSTTFESHQGAILLFECDNGRLLSVVDATSVTAIRTAAASGVATKALAREDSSVLGVLGSGVQAEEHLEAMKNVRPIAKALVWSRNPTHARRYAEVMSERFEIDVKQVDSARDAVHGSDIVCTTTAATSPILEGKWLSPGTHVNAVGGSVAPFRELDGEAVARSKLYTDRRESLLNEAEDFRGARAEGAVDDGHLVGEIGELLIGKVPGRSDSSEITLFKSLGLAAEDLAAAHHVYTKALEKGLGTKVEFNGRRRR